MFKLTRNTKIKLNNCVETFFKGLGYGEIKAKLSNEFAYFWKTEIITYTLFDFAYFDLGFQKYVRENYPTAPEISLFTLSLLHELGHHITLFNLDFDKYQEAQKIKKKGESDKVSSMQEAIDHQIKYCDLYDEKEATAKAIELLTENYEWCLLFELHFKNIIKHADAV